AEIQELRNPAGGDQNVSGFDVTVHDAPFVGELHGGADEGEKLHALPNLQAHLPAVDIDRLAADELHDKVGEPVGRGAAIDQGGDVGMFESSGDLPFAAELADDAVEVEAHAHDFDRYFLVEDVVRANGAINGSHAAAADAFDDLIGAQARAQQGIG